MQKLQSLRLLAASAAVFMLSVIGVSQQPVSSGRAIIRGRVTSAVTGEPIRAFVSVTGAGFRGNSMSGPADASGNYNFSVEPGIYRITVSCSGCSVQAYGQTLPGTSGRFVQATAEAPATADFRMLPSNGISGRILDKDGDPVSRVTIQVFVYRFGGAGDRGELIPVNYTATSDDRGEYRLFSLNAGEYFVGLIEPVSHRQIFFPGVLDPDRARSLSLMGGTEISDVNFSLAPINGVTIRGRVIPVPERRMNIAEVRLRRTDGLYVADGWGTTAPVYPDGSFELRGVVPGIYDIQTNLDNGYNGTVGAWASERLEVRGTDVNDVELRIQSKVSVRGKITLQSPRSFPMATHRISLHSVRGPDASAVSVDSDGSFLFKSVIPGTYRVTLSHGDWAGLSEGHLESIEFNRANAFDSFTVGSTGELQIMVGFSSAQVSGTILDSTGKPFPLAFVALLPDAPRRGRPEETFTGASNVHGEFHLDGVSPGDYHLFAWEEQPSVYAGSLFNPQYMKAFEQRGTPVHVEKDSVTKTSTVIIMNR